MIMRTFSPIPSNQIAHLRANTAVMRSPPLKPPYRTIFFSMRSSVKSHATYSIHFHPDRDDGKWQVWLHPTQNPLYIRAPEATIYPLILLINEIQVVFVVYSRAIGVPNFNKGRVPG